MNSEWSSELLQPISEEQPCGVDLEGTQLLASFDGYRLYGRTHSVDAPPPPSDNPLDKPDPTPDWVAIRQASFDALRQSKDLRLLAHLGAALLRTDGLPAFLETINVAASWLDQYWEQSYPVIDGDGFVRRSALNNFADPMAVIDGVRRAALVKSRQHGIFGLRDVEAANGHAPAAKDQTVRDLAQISAAFTDAPIDELSGVVADVGAALESLKTIDLKMREIGTEAAPTFDPLLTQLTRIGKTVRTQIAARSGGDEAAVEAGADSQPVPAGPGFSGAIRTRDEAMRALDAVAEYFRRNEPSSPVPMFCDRAKRLVAKPFLEVLADIAPEAVAQARAAGGVRD